MTVPVLLAKTEVTASTLSMDTLAIAKLDTPERDVSIPLMIVQWSRVKMELLVSINWMDSFASADLDLWDFNAKLKSMNALVNPAIPLELIVVLIWTTSTCVCAEKDILENSARIIWTIVLMSLA